MPIKKPVQQMMQRVQVVEQRMMNPSNDEYRYVRKAIELANNKKKKGLKLVPKRK